MSNRPIGMFDSGVGGLTIFSKIRDILPNENLIYLGDTKNFPYGDKCKELIIEYAIKNVKLLLEQNVKVIVIACGTVTSQAIDILKYKFNIPIIGIIEPTVEYISKQKIDEIGVIATEGTIKSNAWEIKLKEMNPNIIVHNKACSKLAIIAEEGNAKSLEGKMAIKEYLKDFKEKHINKIILGCTHYSIYEDIIKKELGDEVDLIKTENTVSEYIKQYLEIKKLNNKENKEYEKIFLTKPEKEFKNIVYHLIKDEITIKIIK